MNETLNPFVEAAATGRAICNRLGWNTGDDQARASKSLRGMRALVRDLFDQAEREGCLDTVVANFNRHVNDAETARVRETAALLINGYGDLLALFKRPVAR